MLHAGHIIHISPIGYWLWYGDVHSKKKLANTLSFLRHLRSKMDYLASSDCVGTENACRARRCAIFGVMEKVSGFMIGMHPG